MKTLILFSSSEIGGAERSLSRLAQKRVKGMNLAWDLYQGMVPFFNKSKNKNTHSQVWIPKRLHLEILFLVV